MSELWVTLGMMFAVAIVWVGGYEIILRLRFRRYRRQKLAQFDAFCASLWWLEDDPVRRDESKP